MVLAGWLAGMHAAACWQDDIQHGGAAVFGTDDFKLMFIFSSVYVH
jgi:hypothetical protein